MAGTIGRWSENQSSAETLVPKVCLASATIRTFKASGGPMGDTIKRLGIVRLRFQPRALRHRAVPAQNQASRAASSQGFTSFSPISLKSLMLRVTTDRSCRSAVAAMRASMAPISRPLDFIHAISRPQRSAISASTASILAPKRWGRSSVSQDTSRRRRAPWGKRSVP